ncbi:MULTISPECIES: MaoC/PaaZ C-terminal domain-containing protein [Rhodococcus]|uniref:3-alpha,7-alpha, 12-alpha-trihydroxy-5-beta-cholest-24-enoyl-CoA hydratase n=1 Tax=Rhodococcus opacus TaxID=37919 RepID=A0A2S8IP33_RHOOP|nr:MULTISPECIES: MaoC/PaaZ C-terminal domain-containing protein [Rhodococcus]PQP16536.1 3-alpha,7-alpha,12-alpha-trihydroxy-5-beta-cholest-24-enoyl-CoA hydratase [Rhodococcus opacus]QQZ14634.1 MaoC family dehydratase N-terminal domain-containing protein [Rhodococcus sp. 21391]
MTIDAAKLLDYPFPTSEHSYTARDAMLYALGVGLGSDPTDEAELPYVYERNLTVLPTMAAVIGHPGPWFRDPATGIDWVHVVHGEQSLEIHAPLHPDNPLRCETQVVDVEDKGPGRGALVRWRRRLFDAQTGALVATSDSTLFCRKDGGFGGPVRPKQPATPWPEGSPTASVESEISPRAALIYRLSGDYNPVHADPKIAVEAGFERPILHGLCTFAHATWSVIRELADGDVGALESVQVRFKAPVFPGQRLRTDMWQDGDTVRFRSFTDDGAVMVLDGGQLELRSERRAK